MGRNRRRGPGLRTRRLSLVGPSLAIAGACTVACVIADPPTDLPRTAERRPTIVRSSVVPSTASVLGTWPSKFIVAVELSDPRADIQWASFVDYNPATGEGFDQTNKSHNEPDTTNGNIRTIEIPITTPSSDACHVVEVVVALHLNTTDPRNAHTPEDPGGDSVTWFYSPSGDLAGCPVLDAGLSPRDLDAEAGTEAGGSS
jgi:hypothetical protein